MDDIQEERTNDWIWGFCLYLRKEEKNGGSKGICERPNEVTQENRGSQEPSKEQF